MLSIFSSKSLFIILETSGTLLLVDTIAKLFMSLKSVIFLFISLIMIASPVLREEKSYSGEYMKIAPRLLTLMLLLTCAK